MRRWGIGACAAAMAGCSAASAAAPPTGVSAEPHWSVTRAGEAVIAVGQSRRFGREVTFNLGCFNGRDLVTMVSVARGVRWRAGDGDVLKAAFELPSATGPATRREIQVAVLRRDDATLFLPGEVTAPDPNPAPVKGAALRVSVEGADSRLEFPLDGYAEAAATVMKRCRRG